MSVPRFPSSAHAPSAEQPNLEQLRKQAKELLQGFARVMPDAIAEVNRFERNPRREQLRAQRCTEGACPRIRICELAKAEGVCRWREYRPIRWRR